MMQYMPALSLLLLNVGLVWLLMAAPLGTRTLTVRARLEASSDNVWAAIWPMGTAADWHHSVLTSHADPNAHGRVVQSYSHLDREGRPIVRSLAVEETDVAGGQRRTYAARVVEDSALDASFWAHYRERRIVEDVGGATILTMEQTDRYRGIAILIFRFFALRREMNALRAWLNTGISTPLRHGFEHPVVQILLAILSTLLLWPFFGLTTKGLIMSSLLTLVIVVHEFGHLIAYRAFGHKSVRMIFVPLLGGVAIGGRPYNSVFEVATCALMGSGVSAFLVPIAIALHSRSQSADPAVWTGAPVLIFLLTLGAFNLLNLLPMNRFDGGQVLRQVFRSPRTLLAGSFVVTLIILSIGFHIGLPVAALLGGLAIFTLISLMGQGGIKPRHRLKEMTSIQRIVSAAGLYAALALHGYAIVYATDRLFS